MAVARTAHLNLVSVSGTVNSQSFNCASATSLIAYCEDATNTAGNTTGVTYNGVALTEIGRQSHPSDNRELTMWGVHNPSTGTNSLVATRTSSAVGRFVLGAMAVSGTDTGTPIPTTAGSYALKANGSSTSSYTFAFSNDGNDYIAGIAKFISGGQASGTGSTLISTYDIISDYEASTLPAGASYSFQVTGTSSNFAGIAVALQEGSSVVDVTVSPSPLTAVFSIPTPTVTAERYVEVTASPLTAIFSIPAPVVSTAVTVSPNVLAGTFSIPTPIVDGESPNAEVLPAPLTATFTISSATITTEKNTVVEPAPLSATFSIPAPTVTLGVAVTVSPDPLTAVFSIPAYTVTVISNITIEPSPLVGTFSMPSSFVRGDFWQDKFAVGSDPFTDKVYNAGDNWTDKF